MDLKKFLGKRTKKLRKKIDELEQKQFSEPITIYVNQVQSVEFSGKEPMVNILITSKIITSLKDAVELNKLVVRSVDRRLRPQVGDIVAVLAEDPTDIYKQVLFALVGRGKI